MDTAHDFTLRLRDLLRRERLALGDFLVALSDFDHHRLWLELGYSSLFDYLRRELGLSKASAFYRMRAAELVRRFPDVVEPLRDGRLCLTSVAELAKVLTPENRHEVLPRFFQLSKQEAKAAAAVLRPDEAPPWRDVVTVVRSCVDAPRLALAAPATPTARSGESISPGVVRPDEPTGPSAILPTPPPPRGTPAPRTAVEPLTAELNRLHFTVSRGFIDKLEAARDALSHSHPAATIEQILEAGLDLLLDRHAKRRALVKKPRTEPRPSSDPEYVPAHVRRAVWERDGGKCQWKLASGGICGSTRRVELDHRITRARGGLPTVENLRCLCRAHNLLAARQVFGDGCMDAYSRNPRADGSPGRRRARASPPDPISGSSPSTTTATPR